MLTAIRVILIIFLTIFGGIFTIGNACIFYRTCIKKEKNGYVPSVTPFLGGIMLGFALILIFGLKRWALCFIPMILDWGCLPVIPRAVMSLLAPKRSIEEIEAALNKEPRE